MPLMSRRSASNDPFLLSENSSLIIDSEISKKKLFDLDSHEPPENLQKNFRLRFFRKYAFIKQMENKSVEDDYMPGKNVDPDLGGEG